MEVGCFPKSHRPSPGSSANKYKNTVNLQRSVQVETPTLEKLKGLQNLKFSECLHDTQKVSDFGILRISDFWIMSDQLLRSTKVFENPLTPKSEAPLALSIE